MEHRCGTRRALKVSVRLATHNGLMGHGTIRDLSASGALIDTSLPLTPQMLIRVRGPWRRSADIQAEVVRLTPTGVGIEWLEFAPLALRDLETALAAEPPLTQRRTRAVERVRR